MAEESTIHHSSKQKAELEWFLKQEVPKVLHPLEASISLCMKSSLLKSSSKLKLMCITSTSGTEALRGTVMLHGDTLCSMELFIKPTKAQTSIKASFRSDKQWKLQQVHDSFNHLQRACALLTGIKNSTWPYSPHELVCKLDEIIKHLIKCQSRLVLPCQLTLQAVIESGFTKMFAPSLPGDTLMNVFIVEDRLVIIHYTVQQAHTNASLNPTKNTKLTNPQMTNSGQALFHSVGSVLEHGGIRYEVSTANRSECVIPMLANTLRTALNAQILCQDLKDKEEHRYTMCAESRWSHDATSFFISIFNFCRKLLGNTLYELILPKLLFLHCFNFYTRPLPTTQNLRSRTLAPLDSRH